VPAYLSWFEAEWSLTENIRRQMLTPGSLALGEVELLLYDEVRESRSYLTILQAIGNGAIHNLQSTIAPGARPYARYQTLQPRRPAAGDRGAAAADSAQIRR
jgi:hypothetical protein